MMRLTFCEYFDLHEQPTPQSSPITVFGQTINKQDLLDIATANAKWEPQGKQGEAEWISRWIEWTPQALKSALAHLVAENAEEVAASLLGGGKWIDKDALEQMAHDYLYQTAVKALR